MPRPLALPFMLAALMPGLASAQITFDAATSQSPLSQCWSYEGSSAPAPSGGLIDFGSSGSGEYRYYYRTDVGGADFFDVVTIEIEAKVISGDYSANPCGSGQRAAVGFYVGDAAGRVCYLGLGADRLFITTENAGFADANNPTLAFNTTGAFHTYRIQITNRTAVLNIDGQPVLTVARPDWPTGQTTANYASFGGDLSSCVPGSGQVRRFSVSGFPSEGAPSQVTLTSPPVNGRTCPGGTIRFEAAATSPLPISYRWQRRYDALTWLDLEDGPFRTGSIYAGTATPTLLLQSASSEDDGALIRLRTTTPCGISYSALVIATISCNNIADLTGLGATPGCDGQLTVDDIIVFLSAFFANNLAIADVAQLGGSIGPDGQLTADDIVAFLAAFFAGCS